MGRLAAVFVLGALAGCDLVFPPGGGPRGDGPPSPDGGGQDGAQIDGVVIDAPPTSFDASFACPAVYDPLPGATSRYHFYANLTWEEAVLRCLQDAALVPPGSQAHTHLVVLDDQAELDAIFAEYFDFNVWVGHSDRNAKGEFLPVTTQDPGFPTVDSPPWATGQPDDSGGQDCVRILGTAENDPGHLDDDFCNGAPQALLCECDAYADDPSRY